MLQINAYVMTMGYWKDARERLGGGNPDGYEHDYVCPGCFDDEGLKRFIEGEATAKICTFCGAGSDERLSGHFGSLD